MDSWPPHLEFVANGALRGILYISVNFVGRVKDSAHCIICVQLKLQRYAFEDVAREVLRREYPVYSPEQLTSWYQAGGAARWKVARYFLLRATLNIRILSKMQLITRTRFGKHTVRGHDDVSTLTILVSSSCAVKWRACLVLISIPYCREVRSIE